MPHLIIEYSDNLVDRLHVDLNGFLDAMATTMSESGLFRTGGIRIRAYPSPRYRVADGDPDNAFVALRLHIAPGRTHPQKVAVGEALFHAARNRLAVPIDKGRLALSLEVTEIDADLRWNANRIHDRLVGDEGQGQ